ncbi:HepT-like ribonuclease domain-containing protein [Anaeromyxobacter oryzisoli]|uniref:HepT-like ribonuclease domain-containing protein n=1 Tax=Anaeromyxobacter oryzisoli TaxID=2925408 RepID=UPI001F5664FE|nr:HepT-like ribonuclease domain-containing protein [Anaeromyxobacter sp. SG63]
MQRDDEVYVGHMLDLSRKVAAKVAGVRREEFEEDENLRLALAHLLQTIGEAARRVSGEF